jgi:hypothetical protein
MGFCIQFETFALRYFPPRDFNQVMAPFSASPIAVQLSGFVSRLFLVAKCAYPKSENKSEGLRLCIACTAALDL